MSKRTRPWTETKHRRLRARDRRNWKRRQDVAFWFLFWSNMRAGQVSFVHYSKFVHTDCDGNVLEERSWQREYKPVDTLS